MGRFCYRFPREETFAGKSALYITVIAYRLGLFLLAFSLKLHFWGELSYNTEPFRAAYHCFRPTGELPPLEKISFSNLFSLPLSVSLPAKLKNARLRPRI